MAQSLVTAFYESPSPIDLGDREQSLSLPPATGNDELGTVALLQRVRRFEKSRNARAIDELVGQVDDERRPVLSRAKPEYFSRRSQGSEGDLARPQRKSDRLCPRFGPELVPSVPGVIANGFLGNAEPFRNCRCSLTECQQRHHLALSMS